VREFSELIRRVADGGQEVVIERHKKPVARISQVGFSPVRWVDYCRQIRRERQPDANFLGDLLLSRGARSAQPGADVQISMLAGTALLDSDLLLGVYRFPFALENRQRVATTAAAMAELAQVAGSRGEFIAGVRMSFLRRIAAALPVLSLTPEALLLGNRNPSATTRSGDVYANLAEATARSVAWPLVAAGGVVLVRPDEADAA
jgi:antitoxin (DNA-binding transcriptional repressor) of toxin-antitoxin stability system